LRHGPPRWKPGPTRVAGVDVDVDFRRVSRYVDKPAHLVLAADVPADLYDGARHTRPGFGIPLALLAPRCDDRPLCRHLPPEGVFRPATAWIEFARDAPMPRIVIADPVALGDVHIGARRYPLAADTSAFYAYGAGTSSLRRLGVLGLVGGSEIGRRAGLYLLEDYDPDKRPLVMIHGLGSNPIAWARLSNAVWGDPELRARFQVWHVVYQSNAPTLVLRRRLQRYLDETWQALDPDGDDAARQGIVLVGHSLGGVLSRLLSVDSGDALWSAAFTAPASAFDGKPEDLAELDAVFRFTAYPGVTRAIFLAAPHRGSPVADGFFGRLARAIVRKRAPEVKALFRITDANARFVRDDVRRSYRTGVLNSIATLQTHQPVHVAAQALLPKIPYHTIAGSLPGAWPPGDGFVPLDSALLPGAASTLVVESGHDVYESAEAIAEVLRILREDVEGTSQE
ncbi:MAG TPA: alpha/beta hydrolase, partial [Tahibacter sp.]|nr:alpha/beta hydrolase [Tahibacter sp.]